MVSRGEHVSRGVCFLLLAVQWGQLPLASRMVPCMLEWPCGQAARGALGRAASPQPNPPGSSARSHLPRLCPARPHSHQLCSPGQPGTFPSSLPALPPPPALGPGRAVHGKPFAAALKPEALTVSQRQPGLSSWVQELVAGTAGHPTGPTVTPLGGRGPGQKAGHSHPS